MRSARFLIASFLLSSAAVRASILPPNNLDLEDGLLKGGISKKEFVDTIALVSNLYAPILKNFKGDLEVEGDWEDSTVNAYADRDGNVWKVYMFGGLARRPEITVDGFALVMCHELGHHVGGFPFVSDWAADEGQADYFATQACARKLWGNDLAGNEKAASSVNSIAKKKCNARWQSPKDRNLCYRVAGASLSLARLLGALEGSRPDFSKPDATVVTETDHEHPKAQCRLDTYVAGGLCDVQFKDNLIPGSSARASDLSREKEALTVSCSQFDKDRMFAGRPKCWFKQNVK